MKKIEVPSHCDFVHNMAEKFEASPAAMECRLKAHGLCFINFFSVHKHPSLPEIGWALFSPLFYSFLPSADYTIRLYQTAHISKVFR